MKKLLLITIILFVSCEAPVANEADSETFEKNVQTIKNTWVAGYMEGNADKVISMVADSIQWNGPNGSTVGIEVLKESVQFWIENFEDVSSVLSKTLINCGSYEAILPPLNDIDKNVSFIYLDPPYIPDS